VFPPKRPIPRYRAASGCQLTEHVATPIWLVVRRHAVTLGAGFCLLSSTMDLLAANSTTVTAMSCLVLMAGATGLILFSTRRATLLGGLVCVLAMVILDEMHRSIFDWVSHFSYFGGSLLLGWLFGAGLCRQLRRADEGWRSGQPWLEDAVGEWCCLGMFCATYMSSGARKLLTSGLSWAYSDNLAVTITAHSALSPHYPNAALIEWVVYAPLVSQSMAAVTLILETCAFMMLLEGRIRVLWACGLLAMHVWIGLLTITIWYVPAMFFLIVFALPASRVKAPPVPRAGWWVVARWTLGLCLLGVACNTFVLILRP
jgi:hypothetical protein